MDEYTLRRIRREDIPALKRIWMGCFGDPESLVDKFFELLPELGTGIAAVRGGFPVGAAYALTGLELVSRDGESLPCGYIYAVALEEESRGLGMGCALSAAAAEAARKSGAKIICTLPAESSLYDWYEKTIGTKCALRRRSVSLETAANEQCSAVSAAEYSRKREALLNGQAHIRFSERFLEFQQALCAAYGGGLYAVSGGVAAAYPEGDCAVVSELICPPEADRARSAGAVGAALGVRQVLLHEPAVEGEAFIAADSPLLPADCVWNLALD